VAGVTSYRTTLTWRGQRCETLADILAPGLTCVFVGLNPSPVSVRAGHYLWGTLGRQFWGHLQQHGILPRTANGTFPDELLLASGFGITDLAKCPSPRANALTREDVAEGRDLLREKIERFRPKLVCSVYKGTLAALTGRKSVPYGVLPETIGETRLFAAPFPYRPAEQVRAGFTELRSLIEEARN
jgi:TDG/mug DNA glycosylase family protein